MSHIQQRSSVIADAAAALRDPKLVPGALLAAGMYVAAGLVPFLGLFLGLFSPVPILYFYYRRGRSFGLTMTAVAFAAVGLLYILLGSPVGGLVFGEYCLMAVLLGEGLIRRLSPGRLVATASAGIIGLGLAVLVVVGIGSGQNPLTLGRNAVDHQIRSSMVMYEALFQMPSDPQAEVPAYEPAPSDETTITPGEAPAPGVTVPALTPRGEILAQAMLAVFPGLMIMGAILMAWANLMVGRAFLARTVSLPPPLDDFKDWRAPERMVFALIVGGFGAFIFQGALRIIAINVLMVVCLIYFFQGISIMAFWFNRKGMPLFLRVTMYTLIGLQQYLVVVVAAVGLFDLWFDFRKLKGTPQEG